MIAEQCVEVAEDEVERLAVAEVEHELLAAEHRVVALGDERPVRMRTEHVAVGVDHLRFDPDAELHAERR